MNLLRIFILSLFIFACTSSSNQNIGDNSSVEYDDLRTFLKDSLPTTLNLNSEFQDIFDQWKDFSTIKTVKKIKLTDAQQLSFPINLLKTDILKIDDNVVPYKMDLPQIIGRFRVLKTDILKINIDDLSSENLELTKSHISDIISSYNALVNTINLELKKAENDDLILD